MAPRPKRPASATTETEIISDDQLPEDMDERREAVAKHNAAKEKS